MCVTEGKGVYFKIEVSGVPQPTAIWYHNGEPVKADYAREIEEDGSLAIPSTELKHSGVYKAVVANQHGSEEREVKLTVDKEGRSLGYAATDEIVSTRPIPIPEFGEYVSKLYANSNQPFKDLYQVCGYRAQRLLDVHYLYHNNNIILHAKNKRQSNHSQNIAHENVLKYILRFIRVCA